MTSCKLKDESVNRHQKMLGVIEMTHYDHGRGQSSECLYHDLLSTVLELTGARQAFLAIGVSKLSVRFSNRVTREEREDGTLPWRFLTSTLKVTKQSPLLWKPLREGKMFFQEGPSGVALLDEGGGPLTSLPLISGARVVGTVILVGDHLNTEDLQPLLGTLAHYIRSHQIQKERDAAETFLTQERSLKQVFFDNLTASLLMTDQHLKPLLVSRVWEEFYQVDHEKDLGKKSNFLHQEANKAWLEILKKGVKGISQTGEDGLIMLPSGEARWVNWKVVPWYKPSGRQGGIIFYTRDFTQEKILKNELKEMVQTLKASNADLDKYAHMCAHDLKEPLRSISIFADLLREDKNLSPAERHNYLTRVVEGAHRMRHLIEGMLAYSQVNDGELERTEILVDDILEELKQDLEALLRERGAEITYDKHVRVVGRPLEIKQLFQNLIVNGIKFNRSPTPRIEIRARNDGDDHVRWGVTDNGIGIGHDHLNRVFNMFSRLELRSEYPGSGIGLAICRKVVESHGGAIWVTSQEGKGSTFHFTLPGRVAENKEGERGLAKVADASLTGRVP